MAQPRPWRDECFCRSLCSDSAAAMATFRVPGVGGLSATAGIGEQPRRRLSIAWLRLSGGSSPGGPGKVAALVLAIQELVANGGGRPSRRRRRSAASPGRTGSGGCVGRHGWWRCDPAVSAASNGLPRLPQVARRSSPRRAAGSATEGHSGVIAQDGVRRLSSRDCASSAGLTGRRHLPMQRPA
jgi:hypothetical protein